MIVVNIAKCEDCRSWLVTEISHRLVHLSPPMCYNAMHFNTYSYIIAHPVVPLECQPIAHRLPVSVLDRFFVCCGHPLIVCSLSKYLLHSSERERAQWWSQWTCETDAFLWHPPSFHMFFATWWIKLQILQSNYMRCAPSRTFGCLVSGLLQRNHILMWMNVSQIMH